MDPTKLPNLDPKLKETYERIMGTQLTPSNQSVAQPPASASPTAQAGTPPPSSTPLPPLNAENGSPAVPTSQQAATFTTAFQDATPNQTPQAPSTSTEAIPPPSPNLVVAPPQESGVVPQTTQTATAPSLPEIPPVIASEPTPENTSAAATAMPVEPDPLSQPQPLPQENGNAFGTAAALGKPKNKFMPVLVVIGTILFFIAYTIFWIKFLGIKLPFLPF